MKGRAVCPVHIVVPEKRAVSFSISEDPGLKTSVWKAREKKHAYQKEAKLLEELLCCLKSMVMGGDTGYR